MHFPPKKMARAASNPKPKPLHPPYLEMISEAISSLKERTGSSQHAIAKFIQEKYKPNLPTNFKVVLSIQLKKFAKSEKLVKVKNSFKLPSAGKSKRVSVDVEEEKKQKDKVKRVTEKAKKMKRLSQVKTPPALKKKNVSMQTRVPKKINSPKKTRV